MKKILLSIVTLLASSIVYAVPHDTITTDSFDIYVQALTFATDVLKSHDLEGIFYVSVMVAITGSIFVSGINALVHHQPISPQSILGKMAGICIVFNAIAYPYNQDILVVDKINHQAQNFQKVPNGVAIPLILLAKFNEATDYIVDKYGSPIVPLALGGNQVTFSLLFELNKFPDKFKAQFPYIDQSLRSYMNVCYKIGINMGYISNTTTTGDFLGSIRYPNYYFSANYFDAASNGNGTPLACIDFYDQLQKDLSDPKVKQTFCNRLLGTVAAGAQCDNILDHNVKQLISPNYAGNPSNVIVDSLIADHVTQAYNEKANRQMYTQGLMQSVMADNWIPQLQNMMTGLAIWLFPIILMFIAYAPVKMLVWYTGLYAWLILWHGIDAIYAVMYQHELVNALKSYGDDISVDKLVSAPTEAMQVAVQYGKQRWQAMTMALTIAGIIGFNVNQVFASSTGASAQSAQSAADSSGSALGGSAGLSGAKQQMFNETTSAKAFNDVVAQSNGNQGYYDNASMQQTVSQLDAIGSAKGKLDAVKDMANVSSTSEYTSSTQTQQGLGQADVANEKANALGTDLRHSTALQNGEVLGQADVDNLKAKGIESAKAGMSVEGLAVSSDNGGTVSNMNLTGATSKGAISQTLDNKGDVVQSKIDGTKQDLQGSTYINKNTVDVGSSYSQGSEFNVRAGTIQKTLEGVKDNETLSPIKASMSNEEYKSQYINQTTDQLSKEMTVQKSESGTWQVNVGGGVGKMLSLGANANAEEAMKYAKDELRSEVASTFDNAKSANDVVDNLHNLENKIQGKSVGDMGEKVVNGYDGAKQVASDIVNNAGKGTSNVDGTQSYYQPTNNSNSNDYHDRSLVDDVKHIGSEIVSEAKSFIGTDAEQTDKKVVSAVANQQQNSNEQDSKAMSTIGTTANELHKSAQQRTAINEAKQGLEKLDATVIDNAKKNK